MKVHLGALQLEVCFLWSPWSIFELGDGGRSEFREREEGVYMWWCGGGMYMSPMLV